MTAFPDLDSLINAASVNYRMQRLQFTKTLVSGTLHVPLTLWTGAGLPAPGAAPSTGLDGAEACDLTTAGAIALKNATGGRELFLVYMFANGMASGIATHVILLDRLAHANIVMSQVSGDFDPVIDGTGRLLTGEGAMLFMEVATNLGSGTNDYTFSYTNQAGVSGRVTPTVVTEASVVAPRVPYLDYLWIPLQDGDIGVRSVQSMTRSGSQTQGTVNIVLARPVMPSVPVHTAQVGTDRDMIVEVRSLPVIRADACLTFMAASSTTTASAIYGELILAEN